MKKVMIGVVMAMVASVVMAESEWINPAKVTTPRMVLYGTTPLKIGSTEYTETSLNAGITSNANATVAVSNLTANGTINVTGVSTFTARPAFNAALGTAGTLTNGPVNNLPAATSNTNGVWVIFSHNGTNLAFRAYPQ